MAARIALKRFMHPQKSERGQREQEFWDSGEIINLPSQLEARGYGNPNDSVVWIVSGWGGRSSQLRSIIEALVVQNFYIIAWDSPSHGNNPQKETHLVDVAKKLEKDLSIHMNKSINLIGHSFGGAACAYLASTNSQIDKLVTIAAPPDIREVFYSFWRRIKLPKSAQKHFIDAVKELVHLSPLELSMIYFYKDVKAKWLVIHDKEDTEVKFSRIENFKDLGPQVHFLFTEKLGHYKILKNTHVTTKIIQFLNTGRIS